MEAVEALQSAELGAGERELARMQDAVLCDPKAKVTDCGGARVTLTTHRLLCVDGPRVLSLALSRVAGATPHAGGGGGIFRRGHTTPKIVLSLAQPPKAEVVVRHTGPDTLSSALRDALRARAWEQQAPVQQQQQQQQQKRAAEFSATMAGVSGLMRREETRMKAADDALADAFRDVDALMAKAKDLVDIADRIKAAMAKEALAAGGSSASSSSDGEFEALLQQMGIAAPVTRGSAGSAFHTELARQLGAFAGKAMAALRQPMLALPDVYCLFNRARGTELVSPDDLRRACELFEPLGLPVRLHRFPSGVLVVRSADGDDDTIAKQIAALVTEHGHLTAFEIAQLRKAPLALAREQAMVAERAGLLCRDETFEAVSFYPNIFPAEVAKLPPRSK